MEPGPEQDYQDYTAPQRSGAALLTINAQVDFLQPDSPLRTKGMQTARPAVKRLVQGFREYDLPIVHCVRLYRPDGSNVDISRRHMVEEGLRVLMPGTKGAELAPDVAPEGAPRLTPEALLAGEFQELASREWAMYRPRWGTFHGTGLEAHLKQLGVTTLVICGFNFSTSGRATLYEGGARDFRLVLASDAVSNAEEEGLKELGRIGVYLMDVDHCLNWLAGVGERAAT
ncbi:MAG: cysteine hydrolase [Rhodospirillales bacterium]|nr:cysteine hydrolase [Rhodospirillales bacterium]